MKLRTSWGLLAATCCLLSAFCSRAQPAPQIVQLNSAQLWQRLEFSVTNVPAAGNPFDPDILRLDATFTFPSGQTRVVPGFWYQAYQRALSGGNELDFASGNPHWRVRFTPPETGSYALSVTIRTNGQLSGAPLNAAFNVSTSAPPARFGYAGLAPDHHYFQTGDGQALRLIGHNVCWFGARGTYDYDDWFPALQNAGENFARIWMCPWAFGIEVAANSRTNYALRPAWQLDYVLQQAEQRGIYLLLCIDYHGMFASQPDNWGGNNFWPQNPYNVTNGGPCLNANAFFTSTAARTIYQKRLRYLIGRYGYSQNLLAWEFFNEIDNDYGYLNGSDVAAWHGVMGSWLHTNDSFGHLVTTSLTGSSDRPEIWTLPQLDFAAYHSYAEPGPALRLAAVARSFLQNYGKPVMIGEFGMDAGGWNRQNDPYLRGFRQGIWGGALGGSVGTGMSWWWENIHGENDYPLYGAVGAILNRTGWGRGSWSPIGFQTSGTPPITLGQPLPGAQPVDVQLPLNSGWAAMTPGQLAVPGPAAASFSPSTLNAFVHGIWHADLKTPFKLNAWLTNNARVVLHLNSVSEGAILIVRADGVELFRTNFVNLDGGYNVNGEYDMDFPVNLPAGNRLIEITNAGNDWFFLDWVRLEQVRPAAYSSNWVQTADAIGLRGPRESLVYAVAPGASFPAGATTQTLPLQQGQALVLTNWPSGNFSAEWYDPATAALVGFTQAGTSNNLLILPMPDFREDLAAIVYGPPSFKTIGMDPDGAFRFQFDSETGGRYRIEQSSNLWAWTTFRVITNDSGSSQWVVPSATASPPGFFRARHDP